MDVIALTSIITSGLVGIAGFGVGVWTARHGAKVARDTRIEQRRADAYLRTLDSVEREGEWFRSLGANLDARTSEYGLGRPIPTLERPDLTERSRSRALLGAFGSRHVQNLYRAWLVAAAAIDREHDRLDFDWQQDGGDPDRPVDPTTLTQLLENLQPAEEGARRALADAMANDLEP